MMSMAASFPRLVIYWQARREKHRRRTSLFWVRTEESCGKPPPTETRRQAPRNFFERSSGGGAAEIAARQKRIRRTAESLRIERLLDGDRELRVNPNLKVIQYSAVCRWLRQSSTAAKPSRDTSAVASMATKITYQL